MKVRKGHHAGYISERRQPPRTTRQIRPALVALGGTCGLIVGAANALELGELRVHSSLGQPLRASIRYALNPNEQLFDYCISFQPGDQSTGLPTITRPSVTVVDGNIVLTGVTPIMEPMLAMRVAVNCPYTAQLAREYTLLMNPSSYRQDSATPVAELPPGTPYRPVTAATPNPAANRPQNARVDRAQNLPANRPPSAIADRPQNIAAPIESAAPEPVVENNRYFVVPGDSLSVIAYRIENRPVDGRTAMSLIFEANKHAFIGDDWDRLKAGVWIDIPDLATASAEIADVSEPTTTPIEVPAAEEIESNLPTESVATSEPAVQTQPESVETTVSPENPSAESIQDWTFVDEPVTESPFVDEQVAAADDASTSETAVIDSAPAGAVDDTTILRPGDLLVETEDSSAANDPAAAPVVSGAANDERGISWWLMMIGGAIVALLIAFFAFGRKVRERFAPGAAPVVAPATEHVQDDEPTREATVIEDVDFEFDGQNSDPEIVELDADLSAGTGLSDSGNLDVAQDFGFSANDPEATDAAMDFEFPEEPAENLEETPTDVIEPSHRIEDAIVAIEAPQAELTQATPSIAGAEDYDMSMIVDATKQPLADDGTTARDLQAIPVFSGSGGDDFGNQTLTSDADIAALEQDYQDELTQTQALNQEILRAAEELAQNMQAEDTAEVTSRLDEVTDPAATSTMQPPVEAENDDQVENIEFEDIGIDPAITVEVAKPGTEITAEMAKPGGEDTAEMPKPGSDATVEMPVKPQNRRKTDK